MYLGNRGFVTCEFSPDWSLTLLMQGHLALINIVIFRATVELVGVFFREVARVDANLCLFVLMCSCLLLHILLEHTEVNLGIVQFFRGPLANLGIVTDRDDVVGILGTNHVQTVNRIVVSIFSENTVEYRCSFGTHIPLDDVT
jgi:hypothetical protein